MEQTQAEISVSEHPLQKGSWILNLNELKVVKITPNESSGAKVEVLLELSRVKVPPDGSPGGSDGSLAIFEGNQENDFFFFDSSKIIVKLQIPVSTDGSAAMLIEFDVPNIRLP